MTKARTLADNFAADINGITAGTGITGGGTSGTVTITNSMATAIDAKGDLVVGTGADTFSRLAVASTAGYLLSVDSAETTGLKWAAPAAGGLKSMTLLNSGGTTLTGSTTVTLSGISNQQALLVIIEDASSANASSNIGIQINGVTTANYFGRGVEPELANNYQSDGGGGGGGASHTSIFVGQMSNNAVSVVTSATTILGTNQSGFMLVNSVGIGSGAGGTGQRGAITNGFFDAAAAVTSISVVSSTGNFDNGTLYVYGMAV